MPELPEVEILSRQLKHHLIGRVINKVEVHSHKLRKPVPATLQEGLMGNEIKSVNRMGKFLLFKLSLGQTLVMHLGMTGSLRFFSTCSTDCHDLKHIRVKFALDKGVLFFCDVRKFGFIDLFNNFPSYLKNLGLEPLTDDFCGQKLFLITKKTTKPIKTLLLEQNKIAGIGNIYANEALFVSNINPFRSAASLSLAECEVLSQSLKTVLIKSIELGGSSMKDYCHLDGKRGGYQNHFLIYARSGLQCKKCDNMISSSVLAGRSTFFCKTCQG